MDLKLIHFAALSIFALTGHAQAQCIADQYVNGCSIPYNFPFYYKTEFTPACHRHDVCYFCGQKYGWTRSQCDKAFKRDMERQCAAHFSKRKRSFWNVLHVGNEIAALSLMSHGLPKCRKAAYVYYLSVKYFGEDNFVKSSPSWCNDPCSKEKGSPL